jgi:hypothetical protein
MIQIRGRILRQDARPYICCKRLGGAARGSGSGVISGGMGEGSDLKDGDPRSDPFSAVTPLQTSVASMVM